MCKLDVKDAYFSFSLQHSTKVLCLGQGIFTSSLFMLRLWSNFNNLYKIAKNTNVSTKEDKYSDRNIFGQYAHNRSNDERDTVIFLLLHNLEFVLNLKKSIVNPVQEIEFLGITKKYLKMCLSLQQKFLTTRTDAYKKAYGAACHPTPTGGNVIYRNNDFILIYWKRKQ